jgi:hypothetical protein
VYNNWTVNLLVVAVTVITVSLAVLIHYEGLVQISQRLTRMQTQRRRKVLYGIFGVLILHVAEIWVFGSALWALLELAGAGHLTGTLHVNLLDAIYLSAATYTTVGFGDLAPVGAVRFLVGTEALTGFVLITWSASFTYLEMEHFWRLRRKADEE